MQSKSPNRYKDIIDNVPGLICQMRLRKDGTRYWSYMSPSGINMLGLDKDLIGESDIAENSSKEDREKLLDSLKHSIKTLTKWEYEFQYVKKNGEKLWLHCIGMPVVEGDEICMNAFILDINDKKRTEILLKESEEKFTKVFSRTPNPVYVTSIPDGVFLEVNEAFCKISGYKRKELIGNSVLEFDFYKSAEERAALIQTLQEDGKLSDYKIDFRVKTGEFRECSVYSEMIEIAGAPALVTIVHDQTEQNASRKALLSSETLYRSLFQNASDGILLLRDFKVDECNPRSLELLGYSKREELIGKSPAEFSPEFQPSGGKSEDLAPKHLNMVLKGENHSFEWVHLKTNGSEFYAEINLSKMIINDEVLVLAFIRDISIRKNVENELIDLQVYLQLQIEKMPIGLIIWDTDFKIKSWNPSSEDIFGFTEEEAIGKHPYDILIPEDQKDDVSIILKRLLEVDESIYNTNENLTKSGKKITCNWSNTPFKKSDGEIIGILSMVQDVTEQKRAEQELKAYQDYLEDLVRERTIELEIANSSLDEREKSVRLLSEITSASNLSTNPEEAIFFAIEQISLHTGWAFGHMVYVNEELGTKEPSGIWYSSDDIRDDRISKLLAECKFASKECPVTQAITTRRPYTVVHNKSYDCDLINLLIKDYGLDSSYVFPIEIDNTIVGVIQFLFADRGSSSKRYDEFVSQVGIQLGMAIRRKRIGDELLLQKSRAEESNRSKSQFLANMSHEIRTPMNSILGFADILSTRIRTEKDLSYLESIRSSGISLMQLLNDILDLSKVEAGKMKVDLSEVYLDNFFSDIVDLFEPKIKEKGLSLNFNIDKNLPDVIFTDKLRVRQVIINLLSNAVKFTDKGRIDFSVVVLEKDEDSLSIKISIKDSGIGISDEFKSHLFETFQQEDGDIARRFEGTGLGLAITKRLVDVLNGKFHVESEKGRGSTFTVILNNIEICSGDLNSDKVRMITPEMIRFDGKRVLLVEDNVDDQNFFNDLMLNVGLDVEIAANGEAALKTLKSFQPHLILSDIRMPVMDGFGFIKNLKIVNTLSKIPVVAISASAMKEDIEEIKSQGFDSYLLKPVQMSDFYYTLMNYIPYDEIEPEDKAEEFLSKDIISPESLELLPEIIEKLDGVYLSEWNKLRKKQAIDKVKKFGLDLEIMGRENNISILESYGGSLLTSVDSFNVEAIKKDIAYFPHLVKRLKSFIKADWNE